LNKKDYHNLNDQDLLNKFHEDHDMEWIGVLLNRYTLLLFGLCLKYLKNENDAKDAVQQIFLKVIQELPKYKIEYFKTWLYTVGKNHCLLQIRNNKNKFLELPDQLNNNDDDFFDIKPFLARESSLLLLEKEINNLNSAQQQCIQLFYLEKYSYQQIIDQTGFTMLQVKSYIQNGKRNLKINMEKNQQND
jgi:RNA polymerase sigma-70 factor (ECF subfamily)